MIDHRRPATELLPTVLWPSDNLLDDEPFETPHGLLIPGTKFSRREYARLFELCGNPDLLPAPLPLPTTSQLGRIAIDTISGCWKLRTYQDKKNRARYGQMSVKGIHNPSSLAHRTMYMIFYGADSLPNGRKDFLDHFCLNKSCCYPRHLELVTAAINTFRANVHYGSMIDFTQAPD